MSRVLLKLRIVVHDDGDDADGDYFEFAYGTSIAELDVGLSLIFSSEEISDQDDAAGNDDSSQAIVFTIGKSW